MNILVVYYSRSGHTRRVAEMIAHHLGADLQELVDKSARKGLLGFFRSGRDAMKEKTTELEPLQHQPGDYDLLVVGTPVWAAHPAPAVRTFLTSHDLSGKKVALFCTMNTRGGEETCAIMKGLISGAELLGTLAIAMKGQRDDQIESRVKEWAASWHEPS